MEKLLWSGQPTPAHRRDTRPVARCAGVSRIGADPQRVVDALADAAVLAAEVLLRQTGAHQPPTLHLLAEDLAQPYLGYLSCRPFRPGADADDAVSLLGWLPSTLAATRLVLTWDDNDLSDALALAVPDPSTDNMVVLDATLTGHTLRYHPYRARPGALTPDGRQTRIPTWGTPRRWYPDGPLPPPVATLLEIWRAPHGGNAGQTVPILEALGYRMHWATRHGCAAVYPYPSRREYRT